MVPWLGLASLGMIPGQSPVGHSEGSRPLRFAILICALTALVLSVCARAADEVWRELEPGLDLARFDSRSRQVSPVGDLVVLRVDFADWEIRVLQPGPEVDGLGRTLEQWCESFGLVAAINAGMYQADRLTHVGYCKVDGKVANPSVNDYLSVLACGPLDPRDPPFRIFDLDEVTLREVGSRYGTVVQNLRLIKRERENRWQSVGDQWAEAALGEDARGRALLIYCATPWSMYEFNEILLALPLELVAAQHLEGRHQAGIWIAGFPSALGSNWRKMREQVPVLPNVLGIFDPTEADAAK